ncbi:carboxypeptidase regulatory-like domain-containing protein [Micromonospora sp. PSH03]|uniref:carboxypeptidase-like regulatory domain-containing protein n=1 Tax=Micromonospora salmantinae TaxID=2911211 RepID=UPI001EE977B5|nr:carboxypeptidase-like regulatory domain-containing protein [Micromonospora salmantinae]MCG5457122.1 carboxypeptidase regulatory-like domain-containing protein [Micromonospora salmantinae]
MSRALLRHLTATIAVALLVGEAAAPAAARTPGSSAPGGVRTVVRDAATGAPVPRACAALVPVDAAALSAVSIGEDQLGRYGGCADEQGVLVTGDVAPGRYRLLVSPYDTTAHGLQWVGRRGGTGERERAQVIQVRPGVVTSAPVIRLDPPGTVVGVVTDAATGAPVPRALVMVVPYVPHPKYGDHGPTTDEEGRYTITGLGPYHWPVQFAAAGLATVWSGGVGGRQQARPVRVRAQQTATLNQALPAGTPLTGAVRVDELLTYAQVIAFDAATGDLAGVADVGDSYALRLLPGQRVKLRCDCAYTPPVWHRDAAGFDAATAVRVRRAPVVVDFNLGTRLSLAP